MHSLARAVVAIGFGFLLNAQAHAQAASMLASAEVTDVLMSIQGNASLRFGAVIPGAATTVDPRTSANAGEFEIHGARRAEFTLDITLPTELRTGAGPWVMPISFGPTAGCHRNRDQQNNCTSFDPSTALVARVRATPFPNNTYFVWIGGAVTPALGQFPGVYSGIITASVAYTGN